MKIATLLTKYLYTKHRLDLPGIGSFFLDPTALSSLENSKHRSSTLEGISFQSDQHLKDAPDLIAFISAESGKMKALAISDLESHLELAQQFLNIGKPFTFDGVGTLVKNRDGDFEFLPGLLPTEKFKDLPSLSSSRPDKKQDITGKYESFLAEPKQPVSWRLPVIILLILGGLGLAIWGGYTISRKAKSKPPVITEEVAASTIIPDIQQSVAVDSTPQTKPLDIAPANYKYILEVAQSKRAFKRYKQLRTNLWEVKLETADSVQYKLVLMLPAINADTTRVLDSLTAMTGKRVYIEHQN